MYKSIYICNKCNHGDCTVTIDHADEKIDDPEWCIYDNTQPTNWKKISEQNKRGIK